MMDARTRALRKKAGLPDDEWGDMMALASSDAEGGINEAQKKVALSRLGSLDLAEPDDPGGVNVAQRKVAASRLASLPLADEEDPEITTPMESMAAARTRQHAERNRAATKAAFDDDPELTAPNAIGPTLSQVQAMRHAHRNKTARDAMFADDPALTPPVGPGIGPASVRTMQHAERNRNADPEMDAAKDGFYARLRAPAPVDQEMVDAEAGFYDRLRNQPPEGGVADAQAMRERYRDSRVGGQSGGSEPTKPFTPGIAPNTPKGLDIGLDESLPSRKAVASRRPAPRQPSDSPLFRGPPQVDMGRRASEEADAQLWAQSRGEPQDDLLTGPLYAEEIANSGAEYRAAHPQSAPPPYVAIDEFRQQAEENDKRLRGSASDASPANAPARAVVEPLIPPRGPDAGAVAAQNSRDVGQSMLDKVRNLRSRRDAAGDYRWIDRLGEDLYAAGTGKKPSYAAFDAMQAGLDEGIKNVGADAASDAKVAASDPNSDASKNARDFWRRNFKTPIADTMSASDLMAMLPSMKQADATRKVDATIEDTTSKIGRRTSQNEFDVKKGAAVDAKKDDIATDNTRADEVARLNAEVAQGRLTLDEARASFAEWAKRKDIEQAAKNETGRMTRDTNNPAKGVTVGADGKPVEKWSSADDGALRSLSTRLQKLDDPHIILKHIRSIYGDGKTPSLGFWERLSAKHLGGFGLDTNKAEYANTVTNFRDIVEKARTGAAAANRETAAYDRILGMGLFQDPKLLPRAIELFTQKLDTDIAAIEAGYRPKIVEQLRKSDTGNLLPGAPVVPTPVPSQPQDAVGVVTLVDEDGIEYENVPRAKANEYLKKPGFKVKE
jgi:hypothetical protein